MSSMRQENLNEFARAVLLRELVVSATCSATWWRTCRICDMQRDVAAYMSYLRLAEARGCWSRFH